MAIETAIKVGTYYIFVILFAVTRYGVSSRPMAASSGFQCSPRHAASGDAAFVASTPHHGHHNGLQRRVICSLPPPILLGIIIAKDHVMVH